MAIIMGRTISGQVVRDHMQYTPNICNGIEHPIYAIGHPIFAIRHLIYVNYTNSSAPMIGYKTTKPLLDIYTSAILKIQI